MRRASAAGSVVLLSGGMDSATCLALAARRAPPVHALTIDYGQRHHRELRAARRLARHFGAVAHVRLRLGIGPLLDSALTRPHARLPSRSKRGPRVPVTYVPARNTILLAIALGYAESHRLSRVYYGANAIDYSGYPDCRPEFVRAFNSLVRRAVRSPEEGGLAIRVVAPLVNRSKADIVRLGSRLGVPWGETWSCYAGGRRPCGRCDACRWRARGFREAGRPDPALGGR